MITTNTIQDIYGIGIALILIIYLLPSSRLNVNQNRIFILLCSVNILMMIGDLITWAFQGQPGPWNTFIHALGVFLYYISTVPVLLIYTIYITEYYSEFGNVSKKYLKSAYIATAFYVAGVILSLSNHYFFYITPDNMYVRGPYFWVASFLGVIVFLNSLYIFIRYCNLSSYDNFLILSSHFIFPSVAMIIQILVPAFTLMNTGLIFSLLLIFVHIQSRRELLIEKQKAALSEARLRLMISQINPHFLFNALTTIKQLCGIDPIKAKNAIGDFASYLRTNMDSLTQTEPIPFGAELMHTKRYINLEKERFPDRLELLYDIQSEDFLIPTLTLQPIVENAVRHGILKREKGGTIIVSTYEEDGFYYITVVDDGVGYDTSAPFSTDRSHIGISNVRARIETVCSGNLFIESTPDIGTNVMIKIPKGD